MHLRRGLLREYAGVLELGIRILDLIIILFTGWAAMHMQGNPAHATHFLHEVAILVVTLFSAIVFHLFGIYRSWRGRSLLKLFSSLALAWLAVMAILMVLLFLAGMTEFFSSSWLGLWSILALGALTIVRGIVFLVLSFMRKHGMNHRRVIILGAGHLGADLARRLNDEDWSGYDVVAFFDDDPRKHGQTVEGISVLGDLEKTLDRLASKDIDEIWIALPLRAEVRVREVLNILRHSTVNIRFVPDIFSFRLLNHSISEVVGIPMLNLSDSPMKGGNHLIKSTEDFILAILILILVSPLMLMITIGVRLSGPGPVIFKQLRHGWDGREIKIYKFRTMIPHAEPSGQVTQAKPNDPRLTPFGAFLRRTSLDELPQFFNVLQGRMSIVGPRPHALAHNEFYKEHIDSYMLRHKVKPGITGWAQVNGLRGETDTIEKMQKRLEYDLYYIEHWSLWFDLKILFLTLFKGFTGKNAY